ncbi:MAG: bi-domain-containing oxidoreductase [Deltaproteobacteria bacterium]|nr:bi-domain-containing oxidoreductase [Deltaproteobacteria bacterium]
MKQVIQNLRNGKVEVEDVPAPQLGRGQLLIQSNKTLISTGTERMLVEFGEANWINKARQQPDKVRMVLDKIKTDGFLPTYQAVMDKLDAPLTLGYSQVGTVVDVGIGVADFVIGDRVVSNGNHCELVVAPAILCAKVPENVIDEQAVFTVLAAIALQGVRLAKPTIGENFVVTGLGLIGLLAGQILRANGCRVLGVDFDETRLATARSLGFETFNASDSSALLEKASEFSRGRGVDGVLIAAATDSNEPLIQASQMCRKKGRVVLVGTTGPEFSRTEFFKKELTFQVSCSYGPGRYDPNYEERGIDYPFPYVRWTEGRNFEAILDLLSSGAIRTDLLISHRFPIQRAAEAYELIASNTPSLGVLMDYPNVATLTKTLPTQGTLDGGRISAPTDSKVTFVGAGNYANRTLIPAFKGSGFDLHTVITSRGVTAAYAAKKFGFEFASTDLTEAWKHSSGNTVVIATRHSQHANLVISALKSGKHVFVEKPLAVDLDQLKALTRAYATMPPDNRPVLAVGFNRRCSPLITKASELLGGLLGPKVINVTVNAGLIPPDHWTQSFTEGRRLIGEGCHFIDLARFLASSPIAQSEVIAAKPIGASGNAEDHFSVLLKFVDGSIATILYVANGHRSFPKERIEIFCQGKALQIDNFKSLKAFGFGTFRGTKLWSQDKGQTTFVKNFHLAIQGKQQSPTPWEELLEVTSTTIQLAERIRNQP